MRTFHRELGRVAMRAREYAVATYSGFKVGAALMTASGKVYTGCNVESSSYGLTLCAERVALFKAISDGERKFKAIAIATDATVPTPPCGACRQVLSDLAGNIEVITMNTENTLAVHRLNKLLPHAFTARHLGLRRTKKSR
ncbi:MAG: cytidine deaminase [Ignavibacteria bacterium GWA2_55_11]|nr:MAG: cytidine deaminase [Ignavibacteria bacterium GWA2_55_11]